MSSWLLTAFVIFGVIYISDRVNDINKRLKRTEAKLEHIAKELGVPEHVINEELSDHTINEELRQLVKDRKKIEAVKKARKVLGLSLREAKDYVDSL